ncbi:MAG: hypothetical protein JRI52_00045 [Deltaproteobacteria bacterium]|nr:hypothetical protein [Deltaproteobacteria bacterium]
MKTTATPKDWEIKDRLYTLINKKPLTLRLSSRHSARSPLLYFDEESGEQRELRYATNMASPFVDEQNGTATMGHIVFQDGRLFVPKEQQNLQKLLSLYHPRREREYREHRPQIIAQYDIEDIELEIDALNIAKTLDIEQAEAIMRVEEGSRVNKMSSREIKRDLLIFAKRKPKLFLDLVNDENVQLRSTAIKAVENRIIKLSQDNRTFSWASNGKKLMTIPFDENPYSAMASWFQTDEGLEVFKSIQKKLS